MGAIAAIRMNDLKCLENEMIPKNVSGFGFLQHNERKSLKGFFPFFSKQESIGRLFVRDRSIALELC
jgi:hypothetical protein